MNLFLKLLGVQVRGLRKQLGFTQAKLASVSGLSRTHISEVECGWGRVSLDSIDKIAQALKVKSGRLLALSVKDGDAAQACLMIVSALASDWKSQCLSRAAKREDITVLGCREEEASFFKYVACHYHYAAVNVPDGVVMIPIEQPSTMMADVPKSTAVAGKTRALAPATGP